MNQDEGKRLKKLRTANRDLGNATAKGRKSPVPGRLVGYARVSTDEQGTDPQLDELRAAGCATILEEHASGTDRGRPVLARLLHEIRVRILNRGRAQPQARCPRNRHAGRGACRPAHMGRPAQEL